MRNNIVRDKSYGEKEKLTLADRYGLYLSIKKIRKVIGVNSGGELLDLGAGYDMSICSFFHDSFSKITAVDVTLNKSIHPNIVKLKGSLEIILPTLSDGCYSAILLNSVLEHVVDPAYILSECFRILKSDGKFLINVPTWRGKYFHELSAFKLKRSPAYEINDHKMYYDKRDLWPLLVKAGFMPIDIKLSYHKYRLNLFGVCTK